MSRRLNRCALLAALAAGSVIAAAPASAADRALQFSGANPGADVVVPDNALFQLGSGFSISATIRWDGTLGYQGIVSKPRADYGNGDGTGYALVISNGAPCVAIIGRYGSNRVTCAPTSVTAGQWTRVTGSYDGRTETITVGGTSTSIDFGYYDPAGQDVNLGTRTNLVIGHEFDADYLGRGFHGAIDDVSVASYPFGPVVASYGFDEGAGTTVADGSGNGLSGTLSSANTPQWVPGQRRDTTTTLSSAPNPSFVGQAVNLSAVVAAGGGGSAPSGTVTFMDGTATLGSSQLDPSGSATLQTSTLPSGLHQLTAVYSGDSTDSSSTSAVASQTVNTPAQGMQALAATINGWGLAANGAGFANQASAAANAFAAGDTQGGCSLLTGMSNHALAQSGKKLSTSQANQIIATAQAAATSAGC